MARNFLKLAATAALAAMMAASATAQSLIRDAEIEETLRNLNLVQSFGDRPVSPWMLEKILDTAIWGPVPENFKNWRFIVIKDA